MSESWVGNGNGYWAVASRRAFDPSRSLREILGELLNGPLGPLHLPDLAVCLREGAGGEPGAIRIGNRASHPILECAAAVFSTARRPMWRTARCL